MKIKKDCGEFIYEFDNELDTIKVNATTFSIACLYSMIQDAKSEAFIKMTFDERSQDILFTRIDTE